jgi:serine phosphatase RsbU (regulator of sigma subunit)/anti-sigma regulatory factor (Ser/Thr protein kinase)
VTSILTETAESGLALLRRLSASIAEAFTADEVARAALTVALEIPGVIRAGIALDNAGGRQLRFVSTDDDALTPTRVRWCLIDAFAEIPLNDAVRSGTDVFVPTADDLDVRYPAIAARQRQLGTAGLVALSLATDCERVGGLLLSYAVEQEFAAEQRWLLGALASQVAQALRKGLAHQLRSTTAEQLQRSLLPRSLPEVAGLSLGCHYQPGGPGSDVGGDWYDVLALPDGTTVLVLGDVMGRGTGAAIVMGEMRAALRAYVVLDPSPAAVLARMDAFVASQPVAEQFLTVAYAVVPADRRTLTFALAGHPPPLVVDRDGPARVLAEDTGPVLGVGSGPWPETVVDLVPGRVLLFYSDGLVESRDRDLVAGVAEVVAHADGMAQRRRQPRDLCARLAQLMTQDRTDDDVTLLAVGATPTGTRRRASVVLPDDLVAPRQARAFLRGTLRQWDVEDDTVDAAELCVSELVTNAVIHTGTSTDLVLELDAECLTVLVHDGGASGQVQRVADPDDPMAIAGRGLALVEALSTAWAAEHGADGTTVWFEVERPA